MANEITDAAFESDVVKSDLPVLVDFWAPWCGPCKQLLPIIEELSKELEGEIKILKCNIDENSNTPSKYGVRSIPSLMIFKDGAVVANKIGTLSKSALTEWIKENI